MMTPSTLRIGKRYRPSRLEGSCDAILIGSGMSALTCAVLLSRMGKKVLVLEQHYTAGGYTHSYERNGYEWDVGVHYIGDMGAPTQARKLMELVTDGKQQWAPMADHYDRFHIGANVYDAVAGRQAFADNLKRYFPGEQRAIDRYLQLLDDINKAMPRYTLGKLFSPMQRRLAGPLLRHTLPKTFFRTTWEVLSELTANRELIAVLAGQWGDNGVPPKRSAFVIHALIARHYLYGGFYPVGGSWKIAGHAIPQIQRAGGEVFTYARVQEIRVERGKVVGVVMADGHFIPCACVISSAGVYNTFERLLPAAIVRQQGYDRCLQQVKPSSAHLGVYIGLRGSAGELGLPKTNFWIYPDNDYDAAVDRFQQDPSAPFPVVYISFPSAKDPDFAVRHPGKSTIEIVAPAPYAWFEQWAGTPWGKRGEDYERFKAQLGERLMAHLYERLPQLRGRVDYFEVSTPLSTEWFCGYRRGELYGLEHEPERFRQDWLTPRTRIPGLWLTGQDVLSCGVVSAMMGGVLTAVAVAGLRKSLPVLKPVFV